MEHAKCTRCGEPIEHGGYMPSQHVEYGFCIDDQHPYCDECGEGLGLVQEFRVCTHCGKPMLDGMTDLDGFYAHEECFDDAMNERFTAGWRQVNDDGCDGYYEWYEPREQEWCGTGIFYTEWY